VKTPIENPAATRRNVVSRCANNSPFQVNFNNSAAICDGLENRLVSIRPTRASSSHPAMRKSGRIQPRMFRLQKELLFESSPTGATALSGANAVLTPLVTFLPELPIAFRSDSRSQNSRRYCRHDAVRTQLYHFDIVNEEFEISPVLPTRSLGRDALRRVHTPSKKVLPEEKFLRRLQSLSIWYCYRLFWTARRCRIRA